VTAAQGVAGALAGGAGGALAWLGSSFYHDALRPLARDLRSGKTTRREMARYGFGVSYGFVAFFALPFSVLTGVPVAHLIFLPADVIGVAVRNALLAFVLSALVGLGVVAGVSELPDLLAKLPEDAIAALPRLIDPVLWSYPAVPLIAAVKMPRRRLGSALVLACGGAVAGALALLDAGNASAMGGALAGTIALIALHVVIALRRARPAAPSLAARPRRIYYALPLLLVAGAASAYLAESHLLAGEPMAALLISQGHELDAAAIALMTAAAFYPLVAVSSVTADSYTTQGTPDWILAIGYLMPTGLVAAFAGAAAMALEVLTAGRSIRLVLGLPVLSEVAAAIREAMGDVAQLALLVGGFGLAQAVAGPLGVLAMAAAWLLNENLGRPLWRLALPPTAAIAITLAASAWEAIT
jgi:hypothetical protein